MITGSINLLNARKNLLAGIPGAKTATAGFYAWPEKVFPSSKSVRDGTQQFVLPKERELGRVNIISRTGGTYTPYSSSRTGFLGYHNY